MVEETQEDFEEIVKKLHNNFGDFFFGQGEIENQISQHPLEVPQNPSSNTKVLDLVLPVFFPNFFQNLQKFFPIFIKFILYTFHKNFYHTWRYKGYSSQEAKFLEPGPIYPVMLGP